VKKVLFITTFFYPQNRVPTLRVGQWSKYLARNGYKVFVLTTRKYSFMGPLGLEENLPENVKVVEVDFLPNFLKKRLEKKENTDVKKKSNISDSVYNIKLLIRRLRNYVGSLFDIHDLWIKPAFKIAKNIVENEGINFIISSYSPPATAVIAHKLKSLYHNVKWIADFRDLWAYNHISHARIFGIYERYKERRVLSNVDIIITVSDPLTEEMKKHYPDKRVYTIENGFDPDEFPNWENNIIIKPKVKDKLVISYLGTIYPEKRDPSILFEACNELIEEGMIRKYQIEINFYGDNKKQLENIIRPKNYNRFNIIKINGFVPRKESLDIQRKSDLLLFLEWNDPSAKGVLTGKLFEYLVSGKPILAVGITNQNVAGKIIEKTKTGKLFVDKDALKQELINIFTKRLIDFYNPDIKEIKRYSRDKQVLKLINIMES